MSLLRMRDGSQTKRLRWVWLLILPFIGLLFPSLYSRQNPVLLGFPFFYWYQLAWVPLTALLVGTVYWRNR
ncbi:MAG: DUF3311 domain-containing protein [Acidobacteriaceae bacterium]